MNRYLPLTTILPLLCLSPATAQPRFEISFAASAHAGPIKGRVFVALSKTEATEPIQQIGSWTGPPPFCGSDINELKPVVAAVVDGAAPGYPASSLKEIPAGDYYVQAVINVYTQFHRSDGHVVWAHMDRMGGPALHALAGQSVQRDSQGAPGPGRRVRRQAGGQQGDSSDPTAGRHRVGEAHQDPECHAHQVLGTSGLSGRDGAVAEGLRRASRRAVSGDIYTGSFRFEPPVRVQREATVEWRRARAGRLPVLPGLERRQFPAHDCDHVPASHAILRRFLRSEFRQQRTIRRCAAPGVGSLSGAAHRRM